MNKSNYLQIFVFAIIVAFIGNLNIYGQNKREILKGKNGISKDVKINVQNRDSKDIQLNFRGDSKVTAGYQPTSIQTILYDQTAGTLTGGPNSQEFDPLGGNATFTNQAADDFTVTGGPWTVRQIIVGGVYFNGTGPALGFNIFIYPDSAGVPSFAPVYSAAVQPYIYDGSNFFTLPLATDAVLADGTYWLSVQCRMDFGAGGQWAFALVDSGLGGGNVAQWQNPLDGFGSGCTTWGTLATCNGITPETELSFALLDVQCPVFLTPVVADFEDGMFPPLCWTQSGSIPLWNSSAVLEGFGYPAVSGYGDGLLSAWVDFYSYASGSEDLITLEFDASGAANPTLQFDWAYATFIDDADELDIYYSTDAGTTWTILLAMPGGLTGILNPFNLATTSVYIPANDEWSTMTLPLPAGTNMIKFTGVPAYGNMLFLDNIKIQNLFFDNFEDPPYTFPGQVACQNSEWTTWTLSPCSNDDATISTNYAYSGTQAALIDFTAPRDVDLIKLFNGPPSNSTIPYTIDSLVTGKYYISFRMYIPTGKTGYFNIQSDFTGEQTIGVWGLECYFNAGGAGELTADAPIAFAWQEDNWNNVLVVVDLNTGTGEFWFGPNAMSQIYQWDWTRGGTYPNCLNAIDYFGAVENGDEMYIDDFRFSDVSPPIPQPANEVGTLVINMDYQYAPGIISPQATVKNYGTNTNTFQVEMTIGSGYSNTQTVTSLAPGATELVTFADWNETTVATYDANVCTILSGDEDPLNDCKNQNVSIWDEDGTWTSGADYPITTYNGSGVAYNDGTDNWLFVMGGNTTSGNLDECYKYNVTTDTWTQIASLPSGRLIHDAAAVGDYIYVIGGSNGTDYTNTTYKYDIAGNSWSEVAILPGNIGWCRVVSYDDNYIYLAGGILDGAFYMADVYLYDVTANTWTAATSLPGEIFGGGFAITGNTLVYATGATPAGILPIVYVGTINLADPLDIAWTTMKNTYPGNGKTYYGQRGANLMSEMPTQSMGTVNSNHPPLAVSFPAGSIYRNHAHTWGDDAIIIGGGTPTANYIAADPGPCYVYKPGTDTWIAQENIPVPVGAHQSGSVQDGSTWKFIIASGFGVDSTESETQIYTQTLGGGLTFGFSVNILLGWNLVSAPGTNPAGMGVANWWPNNINAYVFSFDGVQYQQQTVTAPGVGYWMFNSIIETNTYSNIGFVTHDPIPVTLGWNIIGGYDTSPTIAALTAVNPQISGLVFGFDGVIYTEATNLFPGYGYWVFVTTTDPITVPAALPKGSGEVVEYFKEDWGRITLTDAEGKSYTLYAVKGEVDLDQYRMPPLPPSGSFDIRFSSGRIAEDINGSMQTIDMTGVTYPLTVRVDGMDIRLQDASGSALNVSLKSGEDVVIGDATVQKLMVSSELIPTVYALEQNYPNPFNPSTVIEFSLPEDVSNVKLSIYNALGEKVAEIVNSSLTAGKYQYQWNAQNVATGMYIYELRADKFVSVKKMLLLK